MVLSEPLFAVLGFYLEQLSNNPIRTKSITCAVIATAGNYASQSIVGNKVLDRRSLLAFGIFGLLFGGTLPHFFYSWLEYAVPADATFPFVQKVLLERLMYIPLFQAFVLYIISRLEGKKHDVAVAQLKNVYWSILKSNWKYLTIIQLINLTLVPPMWRVFIVNIVGFFWTIFIANKRRQAEKDKKK